MSLENYAEDIEDIEESIEGRFSRHRAHQIKILLDHIMPFVLLLIGFIIVFEFFLTVTPRMATWITWANWALIGYFVARLGVSYRLSTNHEKFVDDHWLDILLVIPLFSIVQEVRLARVAPALADLPVFRRGILHITEISSTAGNAAKLTRITRIIKRSV